MRILLAAHPTVGHTQALRAVGSLLQARGHQVAFAVPRVPPLPSWLPAPQALRAAQGIVARVSSDGFEWVSTPFTWRARVAAARIDGKRGYEELGLAADLFAEGMRDTARQLSAHCRERKTDLVVHDFTFLGAWLAAESVGVPSVAVFHSGLPFEAPGAPPFGSGLDAAAPRGEHQAADDRLQAIMRRLDARVARARRALQLPPVARGLLMRPYSQHLNVLTSHKVFELPRPHLAAQAAGPLLWAGVCAGARREDTDAFPWSRLRVDKPLVYISLGTVFNDQPKLFRLLLQAVHHAGATAVVAAGAASKRVRRDAGPDDVVVAYAPQLALLRRAALVVGHGGNNSTNETLRAGKPLLVIPFGAEQIANGQRVEALGVGRLLRDADLTLHALTHIVRDSLSEDARRRARALAESAPFEDGAAVVADALERLAL
jgi:MGT family glycosyltransferase